MGEKSKTFKRSTVYLWVAAGGLLASTFFIDTSVLSTVHDLGEKVADSGLLNETQQHEIDGLLNLIKPSDPSTPAKPKPKKRLAQQHSSGGSTTPVALPTIVVRRVVSRVIKRPTPTPAPGPSPVPIPVPEPGCSFDPPGKATGRDNGKCPPGQMQPKTSQAKAKAKA